MEMWWVRRAASFDVKVLKLRNHCNKQWHLHACCWIFFPWWYPFRSNNSSRPDPTLPTSWQIQDPKECPAQSIKPAGSSAYGIYTPTLQTWEPQVVGSLNIFQYFPKAKATGSLSENPEPKVFDELQRPAEKPAFFGTHPPEGYGRAKVDQKECSQSQTVRNRNDFSILKTEHDSLVVGDKPNLEAILTEWGLTKQIWNKASVDSQIRLLAAVWHIKNWLVRDTNSVGYTNEDGQLCAFREFKQT